MDFCTIYVLLLENDKYYIGFTRNLNLRLVEHWAGLMSSKWTTLYKPIRLIEVLLGNKELETLTTLRYMVKFGWENVRGGNYCRVTMKNPPKKLKNWI